MTLTPLTPEQARQRVADGAVLVDIRGRDEHARERIAGAVNLPLEAVATLPDTGAPVVFHCRSGGRTSANAARLASATPREAFVVEGGIDGWKRAGLPVLMDKSQPLELQRQVQIVAGTLILIGVLLSQFVAAAWIGLSAFVGAGLVFAGLSGWCGMARLLAVMPWNRQAVPQG